MEFLLRVAAADPGSALAGAVKETGGPGAAPAKGKAPAKAAGEPSGAVAGAGTCAAALGLAEHLLDAVTDPSRSVPLEEQESVDVAAQLGAGYYRALLAALRGLWDEAERRLGDLVAALARLEPQQHPDRYTPGTPTYLTTISVYDAVRWLELLVRLLCKRRRWTAAGEACAQALEVCRPRNFTFGTRPFKLALASIALSQGRTETALADLRAALAQCKTQHWYSACYPNALAAAAAVLQEAALLSHPQVWEW